MKLETWKIAKVQNGKIVKIEPGYVFPNRAQAQIACTQFEMIDLETDGVEIEYRPVLATSNETEDEQIKKMEGYELEARIKILALETKPHNFEQTCEDMQKLVDEQNRRGAEIAKKHKMPFTKRKLADVFDKYWVANKIANAGDNYEV